MSATPHLASSDAESFRLKLGRLSSYFTITGNTTDASSAATTVNPVFRIYLEEGSDSGDPTVADADHGFSTLDDDADPAVVGFLGMVGDAAEFYGKPIFSKISGDTTACTFTLEGTGTTGVTPSKNLSFTGSFAGVDIDANTNVQAFFIEALYRKV